MTMAHRTLKRKISHAESKMKANRVALRQQAQAVQQHIVSPKTLGLLATGAFLIWLTPKTIRGLRHKFFAKKVNNTMTAVMDNVPPTMAEKVSGSKKMRGMLNYMVDGAAAISSLSSIIGMLKHRKK